MEILIIDILNLYDELNDVKKKEFINNIIYFKSNNIDIFDNKYYIKCVKIQDTLLNYCILVVNNIDINLINSLITKNNILITNINNYRPLVQYVISTIYINNIINIEIINLLKYDNYCDDLINIPKYHLKDIINNSLINNYDNLIILHNYMLPFFDYLFKDKYKYIVDNILLNYNSKYKSFIENLMLKIDNDDIMNILINFLNKDNLNMEIIEILFNKVSNHKKNYLPLSVYIKNNYNNLKINIIKLLLVNDFNDLNDKIFDKNNISIINNIDINILKYIIENLNISNLLYLYIKYNNIYKYNIINLLNDDKYLNYKDCPLMIYINKFNINLDIYIIKILKTFKNIEYLDNYNNTCLHLYLKNNKILDNNILNLLISNDNLNIINNNNETPLHIYLSYHINHSLYLINLLKTNININIIDNNNNTLLHIYLLNNKKYNYKIINSLVSKNNLNIVNKDGNTILHILCENKYKNLIPYITKINKNISNNKGKYPIDIAFIKKYPITILDLLK